MIWNNLSILSLAGIGVLYALWCAWSVLKIPVEDKALLVPASAIQAGAGAFIRTQYLTVLIIGVLIFIVLWRVPQFGLLTAIGFAIGGFFSALSGIIGMNVSVRANVRTAIAAGHGLSTAFKTSLTAGSVTGFLVGSLVLLSVSGFYLLLIKLSGGQQPEMMPMIGLGFGASLISIFSRLGGGIFTKAADVGADLAGKIEQGIPEDDARNPAVIADNVGDNVGDCAGMAADVFESYVVTLIATMLVAGSVDPDKPALMYLPLALGSVAILCGMIGMQFIRLPRNNSILTALTFGVFMSVILTMAGNYFLCQKMMSDVDLLTGQQAFLLTVIGLIVALALIFTTDYFTSSRFRPVLRIVQASKSGHATNIITGLAVGLRATTVPTLIIVTGILVSYGIGGIYGIAISTCAMLALTPVIISIDAYGPVTDNAGGIVEMAGRPDSIRCVTDQLDAAGNTTKAVTKTFAIGSAALAALVLFAVYNMEFVKRSTHLIFTLDNAYTLSGIFIGSLVPFLFSGFALEAVGGAAAKIVQEVRRQFQEHPGILSGEESPDYEEAVRMLTLASIKGMLTPALFTVIIPLLIALLWQPFSMPGSGAQIMGGVLIGAIASGLLMALSMTIGGAAWDNAKKYIEAGHEGGKGSAAHHAAITGDTVGDPYKDTAGPAINPMLKVLNILAVLLVPFLV